VTRWLIRALEFMRMEASVKVTKQKRGQPPTITRGRRG